ncbi:MAG: ABC transporter substrate-binding protein [Methanothrix sp.]|nr:ABC transporter substrate-binding protein [Methanothrix sp.]MDD4446306.1 ABC transporter substrate-binding protein [Methanothrix sp.]
MSKRMQLLLAASVVLCILLSGFALAQNQAVGKSESVSKLIIGTTDQVEDINVNDGIFNTYREAFLTKSLIRVDPSGNFVPALAESWETKDAKKWVFHLVKNATWHDGEPVTAADLKFSLEYLPKKLGGSNWNIIDSVEAPDDSTLIINLLSPDGNFLTNLLMLRSVPKHIFEKVEDPKKFNDPSCAIGCGPYKFVDYEKAAGRLRFQAYDEYYEGKPAVREIDIRMFKNQEAMMMALLKEEIDTVYIYSGGISYYYVPRLMENEDLGYILIKNSGVPAALWLNQNKTPFDDVRFREAISYAIDYQELQNLFTAGYGATPAAGFIPDGSPNCIKTRELSFNTSQSIALLNATGMMDTNGDGLRENADGRVFQPQILVKSDSDSVRLGEMLKKYLSAVGLDAQLKVTDSSGFWDEVDAKEHEMFICRTTPWGMMMEAGYATGYMDTRSNGWPMVNDPAFTKLVDDLLACASTEETAQLAGSVQEYYAKELPAIALYWNDYVQPYNKKYDGYVVNPIHGILSYETFYELHTA